ncbi:butyrophilin subfamily 1 member A1-like [Solea solea]|uniref:butyrophilin subfamily 1 member A1-like n=1 Tax=Solea solea TaxID=90069 RepID=UPI00272CBE50|nr:butyrophilin subfamily 1 member A1-like [Solea solea]
MTSISIAVTVLWHVLTFSRGLFQDLEEVIVKPGDDALLGCHAPPNTAITGLIWSRPGADLYVLFYRDGRALQQYQLQPYQGRVDLSDPTMANGNASVIVRNVSADDAGEYKCYVRTETTGRRKRDMEPRSVVHLKVEDTPSPTHGGGCVFEGVSLCCMLPLLVLLSLCSKTFR